MPNAYSYSVQGVYIETSFQNPTLDTFQRQVPVSLLEISRQTLNPMV